MQLNLRINQLALSQDVLTFNHLQLIKLSFVI